MQPAAFDVAYLLLNILQLLQLCNLSGALAIEKFRGGIRVFNWLTLINHSCQLVLAAALRLPEEASLLVGREDYDCLPIVCKVFKNDVASGLNGTVPHDRTTKLKVNTLKTDVVTISKPNVVGATQPRLQAVCAHAAGELVEAPVIVGAVIRLHQEICNRWVM